MPASAPLDTFQRRVGRMPADQYGLRHGVGRGRHRLVLLDRTEVGIGTVASPFARRCPGDTGKSPGRLGGLRDFFRRHLSCSGAQLHRAVRLWDRDRLHLDESGPVLLEVKLVRHRRADIHHPAAGVGAAVLNVDRCAPAILQCDLRRCPQRQTFARSDVRLRVHPLPVGHLPVGKLAAVIRRASLLLAP